LSADQITQIKLLKSTRVHYGIINVTVHASYFITPTAKANIEIIRHKKHYN